MIINKDKLKGLVYSSLLGDALGLPHEFDFDPARPCELFRKKEFLKPSMCSDPWGCWSAYDDIAADQKGILSDDSFFKLEVLIPYLSKHSHYRDDTFAKYCLSALKDPKYSKIARSHFVDWLFMLGQINLPAQLQMYISQALEEESKTQGFYNPKSSACFGLFLFLWQGAFRVDSVTKFDSDGGRIATSSLMQEFNSVVAGKKLDVVDLLKNNFKPYSILVKDFADSIFTEDMQTKRILFKRFRESLPSPIVTLKHDPLEFLVCMSVCQLVFPDQPLESLKLISSSGGDADTLGAIWGTFLGASFGYDALIKQAPEVKRMFADISEFLDSQSIVLEQKIDEFYSIALL